MCKICTGTEYDREHCEVEKRGCSGCGHYKKRKGEKRDEQKISKYSKNKKYQTN